MKILIAPELLLAYSWDIRSRQISSKKKKRTLHFTKKKLKSWRHCSKCSRVLVVMLACDD